MRHRLNRLADSHFLSLEGRWLALRMYDFRQLDHQHGLDTTAVARVVFGFWVVNVSGKHLPFAALEIAVVVAMSFANSSRAFRAGEMTRGVKD